MRDGTCSLAQSVQSWSNIMSSFKSLTVFSSHSSFLHHSDCVRSQRNVLSHDIGIYVTQKCGIYVTSNIIDSEADFYTVLLLLSWEDEDAGKRVKTDK